VSDFQDAGLALAPRRHLAIVACMDSRMDIFQMLGLAHGDAHIIRNAGGVVTDDVIRSLVVSLAVSKLVGDFAPFAGVVSSTSKKLSDFCFGVAFIFGIGATVVLPVFFVGVFETTGLVRFVLYVLIVLVVGVTVALLALPAFAISRQVEGERQLYLDQLSIEIEDLVADLRSGNQNSDVAVWDTNVTMRLNALLEIRKHVMVHMASDSALKMVRRIPFVLIGPVGSSVAAWLALVFG
jgi:hypothetical protein